MLVACEHWQKYIDRRPVKRPRASDSNSKKPAAKPKASSASWVIHLDDDNDDGEFGVGDFSAIEILEKQLILAFL